MLNIFVSNFRMELTKAKPSALILGGLYYFICVVLLFSGVSKIIDPAPMIETMKATIKVNENLLILAATFLPMIEIALGLMMVLKLQTKKVLLATTALFFCFFAFSIYGTAIGLNVDCGCFGSAFKSEFGTTMIIRNLVLTLTSLSLVLMKVKLLKQCYKI